MVVGCQHWHKETVVSLVVVFAIGIFSSTVLSRGASPPSNSPESGNISGQAMNGIMVIKVDGRLVFPNFNETYLVFGADYDVHSPCSSDSHRGFNRCCESRSPRNEGGHAWCGLNFLDLVDRNVQTPSPAQDDTETVRPQLVPSRQDGPQCKHNYPGHDQHFEGPSKLPDCR